jgi:hypothetical protein
VPESPAIPVMPPLTDSDWYPRPIPDLRGLFPACRQDPRPVGTEHRGIDIALMLEARQQLPGDPFPEPRASQRCRGMLHPGIDRTLHRAQSQDPQRAPEA